MKLINDAASHVPRHGELSGQPEEKFHPEGKLNPSGRALQAAEGKIIMNTDNEINIKAVTKKQEKRLTLSTGME